jgi:hypothetical protein
MVSNIRNSAKTFCNSLRAIGMLPRTWGELGHVLVDKFNNYMYSHHPEVGLCHNFWKAQQVATEWFAGYDRPRKGQNQDREVTPGSSFGMDISRSPSPNFESQLGKRSPGPANMYAATSELDAGYTTSGKRLKANNMELARPVPSLPATPLHSDGEARGDGFDDDAPEELPISQVILNVIPPSSSPPMPAGEIPAARFPERPKNGGLGQQS